MWDWPSGWLMVRLNPNHGMWAAVQVLTIWSGICLKRIWCLPRSPFGYACEAYRILFWWCLKLATGCVGSGSFGRDSYTGQCKTLPMISPQQPVWSYKLSTVCGYLSRARMCVGRNKLCTNASFTSSGPRDRAAKVPRHSDEILLYLPLPTGCLLGSLTERASGSTPQEGVSSTGWDKKKARGWGYCFPSGWCHMRRVLYPKIWHLWGMHEYRYGEWYGEWLSIDILAAVPSAPFPKPQTPGSPYITLIHSTLISQEPSMSSYK